MPRRPLQRVQAALGGHYAMILRNQIGGDKAQKIIVVIDDEDMGHDLIMPLARMV